MQLNDLVSPYLAAVQVKENPQEFKNKTLEFNTLYDKVMKENAGLSPARVANYIAENQKIEFGGVYFNVFKMRLESSEIPVDRNLCAVDIRKAGTFQKPQNRSKLMPDDMDIIDASGKVVADVNVYFGVAFVVTNLTEKPIKIKYELTYPPMTNPETGETSTGSTEWIEYKPGATERGHYYYFLDEWEMVEGTWEFSYSTENGDTASKKFEVVRNK